MSSFKNENVMMTLKRIKENLCYSDLRNPNVTVDEETAIEIAKNNADCYCDNCFRGKNGISRRTIEVLLYGKRKVALLLTFMVWCVATLQHRNF